MVVISTTVTLDEHDSGKNAKSKLADGGWSTIVRLLFEQHPDDPTQQDPDDPQNWISACRRSVALIVDASHQSSSDMVIKAQASALAHFATKWDAKARIMWMCQDAGSVPHMNPLKQLRMGKWPCLRCILWDDQNGLELAAMTRSSIGTYMLQSAVTTSPDLCQLILTDCKIEAAALTCLNQACFARLYSLDLSLNPLGWSGVQSLSKCDLPALQYLNLDDTNVNALAAVYLAQGCWPNLKRLHLLDNQLNVEAVAYLVKVEWPLLKELHLSWTCVPEAAFEVLGVADACKQFESTTQLSNEAIHLLRSSSLLWPEPTYHEVMCNNREDFLHKQ